MFSPTSNVQLSPDQSNVLADLMTWLKNPLNQSITVGGYAGTGKTTLISILRHTIAEAFPKYRVAFACYTGKASQVLKQKLLAQKSIYANDFCGTIHSLMYQAVIDEDGKIERWKRNSEIPYDLIIVDEASMVTSDIWNDLTKYQLPIIAVGDHGQLPPIESAFSLMETPQIRLEQIHRQSQGNPIIEIATIARTTGQIPFKKFSEYVKKVDKQNEDVSELLQTWFIPHIDETLILCARNKTRVALNQHIRSLRGFESNEPQIGETLICLKNNYEAEGGPIYNGMHGTLKRIEKKYIHWYDVDIAFADEDRTFTGDISQHQFNQEKVLESIKGIHYSKIGNRFDFGYALTVHKAQGSQSKSVIVFEEFAPYMSDEEWRRWLYTAVTRASERLLIIK
jgi:exodeoxyribonuclease-5